MQTYSLLVVTVIRFLESFGEFPGGALYVMEFLRPTNYSLPPCVFLEFQKIFEIRSGVEFHFTESDTNRFSTE